MSIIIKEYRMECHETTRFVYGTTREEAHKRLPTVYQAMTYPEDLIEVRDIIEENPQGLEKKIKSAREELIDDFIKKPWGGY